MIRISVCDDDLPTTERVEELLSDLQYTIPEKIEVSLFYSGESFSKTIQQGCPYDIIIMDIEMEGVNGIEAGHALRASDENDNVQLIYISSHEQYHVQLFDVHPSGFIKKPLAPESFKAKLTSVIHKAIRKRRQAYRSFLPVRQKGSEQLVPFREIMYLESNLRKISLYTGTGPIEYYGTLNEEEKKLTGGDFIRIHQSYIVNFYFVREIAYSKLVLVTGKTLPISEKRSSAVRKNYLKFRGDFIG